MALAEVPFRVSLVEGSNQFLSRFWLRYFQSVVDVVNNSARKLVLFSVTGKNSAIAATALDTGALDPGLYRITYSARVTTAATTGAATSSVTVTISWMDGDVAQSQSGAAMTGNTTATEQNGTVFVHNGTNTLVANDVVKYATAYASDTASQMQYSLYVLAERIG
jgi:hypothetical protein